MAARKFRVTPIVLMIALAASCIPVNGAKGSTINSIAEPVAESVAPTACQTEDARPTTLTQLPADPCLLLREDCGNATPNGRKYTEFQIVLSAIGLRIRYRFPSLNRSRQ